MKRRTSAADRAQAEQEAMAELQRAAGSRPASTGRAQSRAWGNQPDRAPAWGAPPEPSWRPAPTPEPELPPEPEYEEEEVASDEADEWAGDEEQWEDDGDGPYEGDDEPIGLLGIPLDYDATGIALEQLASRSNVRQPVAMVMGVNSGEAERLRDQAMAKFLEGQKVRARQDAERLAATAAVKGSPAAAPPRAPFPPLSPGLSAKSLVMQPVAAPPLNLPTKARAKAAAPKKTAAKKAVAATKAGGAKNVGSPKRATTARAAVIPKVDPKRVAPAKAVPVARTVAAPKTVAAPNRVAAPKAAAPRRVAAPKVTPTPVAASKKAGAAKKVAATTRAVVPPDKPRSTKKAAVAKPAPVETAAPVRRAKVGTSRRAAR